MTVIILRQAALDLFSQPPEPRKPQKRAPKGAPHFNGPDYVPEFDHTRLTGQIKRIRTLMLDSAWRTLSEISDKTGDPPSSISAQLRHLRKRRFGSHVVEKRPRGKRSHGLWEYRVFTADHERTQ